jgi:branched-chain amino acid transport system substrate-binding protein
VNGLLRNRAAWLFAMLLVVAALVAAGCGGDDEDSGGGGSETSATDTGSETSTAAATAEKVDLANCSEVFGSGQFTIVSDLPLQGSSRLQTEQMVEGIKYVLEQREYKAGAYTVQYQSCDDATAQAAKWDSAVCSANANAYARNETVIGVIGTFNSGCAAIIIPILGRAPNGPIGMVSPANTYVGLTHTGPGLEEGEPDKFYPTGTRNYARVVAADDFQGAADALLAQKLGVKSVYILNDKESYGLGVARQFERAIKKLGIKVAGFDAWDAKASSYESLFQKVKASGADAVFLGGLIDENGGQVIKDKVSVLGDNTKVKLIAPDGFTTTATLVGEGSAGPAGEGMYLSVAGVPPDSLEGAGKEFIDGFKEAQGLDAVEPYTAYAAQALEVLLTAIEGSDGTRADVASKLFGIQISGGILGDFTINENGDSDQNPVTIFKATGGKLVTDDVIVPPADLVTAE